MNRHTKHMLATILLVISFAVSGVISSTVGASIAWPDPAGPPALIVENP